MYHLSSSQHLMLDQGLGKDISFIQMKMIASAIIWNYHVQVVEDHLVSPSISVVLHMKHGLKVRISKRYV